MFYLLLLLIEVAKFEFFVEIEIFGRSLDTFAGKVHRPHLVEDEVACIDLAWRNAAEALVEQAFQNI